VLSAPKYLGHDGACPCSRIRCPKCVDAAVVRLPLAEVMNSFKFRIVALSTTVAEAARAVAIQKQRDHRVMTVESPNSAPCRHCLKWAKPGERVILFPYDAIAPGRPYSERGPIFIHADPCARYTAEKYPDEFRQGRVFRAYNKADDLIDAQLPNGEPPELAIEKLLRNPDTAFVHARSISHGCYTFRVERS
jgi:Protein of unknown function (DUF1203)